MLLLGMQFDVATVKDKLEIPQKQLKVELPHEPGTPVLCIYPDKTTVLKDTRAPVFTATLLKTAKTCK